MKKVQLLKPALDLPAGAIVGLADADADALVSQGDAIFVPSDTKLLIQELSAEYKSACLPEEGEEPQKPPAKQNK